MKILHSKKAGGELLGFTLIVPLIIVLIWAIVGAAQISDANQDLNYCVYNTCRAAVVCDSYDAALKKAERIYELQFGADNCSHYGYESLTLELVGDSDTWEKGQYVKCTIRYYVTTLAPFVSGVREKSIIMMIENGGD